MVQSPGYKNAKVKVYHGYGHTHDLVVYGHVFAKQPTPRTSYTNNVLINILHLLGLFFVQTIPRAKVQLQWRNQVIDAVTEDDGFFKFEWKSDDEVSAGWHSVTVNLL